jgi:8-oxo-dGTP pyrophosphatase MutT (NUDIX family)
MKGLIGRAATPPVRRGLRLWTRLTRSVTLGVRTMVLADDGRVFLVRHGYVDGWHLPGGAVDPGETSVAAAVRELAEEGNIAAEGAPELAGLYLNAGLGRDHVALYVVRRFIVRGPPRLGREIAAAGFFAADAPPPGTTPATLRRIAEVVSGDPPAATW